MAVYEMEQFTAFMNGVTEGDLQGFWGRCKLPNMSILCVSVLINIQQWGGLSLFSVATFLSSSSSLLPTRRTSKLRTTFC